MLEKREKALAEEKEALEGKLNALTTLVETLVSKQESASSAASRTAQRPHHKRGGYKRDGYGQRDDYEQRGDCEQRSNYRGKPRGY